MAGFTFAYRLSGGAPTVQSILCSATATLTVGDIANLSSGQLALGATSNTNLVGAIQETKAGTAATTRFEVITDDDAVYSVTDANARLVGATLDLSGATGAQAVTTSSNKEFVVVEESTATQPTLVKINVGKHYKNKAQ